MFNQTRRKSLHATTAFGAIAAIALPLLAAQAATPEGGDNSRSEQVTRVEKAVEEQLRKAKSEAEKAAKAEVAKQEAAQKAAEQELDRRNETIKKGQNYELELTFEKTTVPINIPTITVHYREHKTPTVHMKMVMKDLLFGAKTKIPEFKYGYTTIRIPDGVSVGSKRHEIILDVPQATNINHLEKQERAQRNLEATETTVEKELATLPRRTADAYATRAAQIIEQKFATARQSLTAQHAASRQEITRQIHDLQAQRDRALAQLAHARDKSLPNQVRALYDTYIARLHQLLAQLDARLNRQNHELADAEREMRTLILIDDPSAL